MVTIMDVAKRAGVAKSTVSKVLHGYANVSEKTKEKVNLAILELGYVPNLTAVNLAKKNFLKIGVIVKINQDKSVVDEINMRFLHGVNDYALTSSIEISIIFENTLHTMSADEIVIYLKSKSINSLIIIGMFKHDDVLLEVLKKDIFKTVVIDYYKSSKNISSVSIDNYKAQYEIAKNSILKEKVKEIGYLCGPKDAYVSKIRKKAIQDLAKELQLTVHYYEGDFSELKAYKLIKKHFKQCQMIICSSDLMAIGAKRALVELDYFLPIVGFDGLSLLSYFGGDIPTVIQDFYKIGQTSVEEVEKLSKGKVGENVFIDYEIGYSKHQIGKIKFLKDFNK